jgi:DeoR family transcriptional regulator, fructose operon transcriptional repressor
MYLQLVRNGGYVFAEERQQLISELVAERGRVSVTDLADRFSITTETVRRDLAALESAGNLRRVHGGAVPSDRLSTREESVVERAIQRQPEKLRIAEAALALIPENAAGSILIDAGSTTEALARLLGQRAAQRTAQHTTSANGNAPREELVVITHAIPIAGRLSGNPNIALQILGGRVRGLTQAAVGQSTVEAASRLRPDIAFVGANGIHATFGLSTPDPEEAAVKAAFVTSARRVVVLADSSKLDAETLVQFAALKDVDTVITDHEPSEELSAALAEAGVDVVIA